MVDGLMVEMKPSLSPEERIRFESLTERAFRAVEPTLLQLVPGDSLDVVRDGLATETVEVGGIRKSIAFGDGWIPALSGGVRGAQSGIGRYRGRDRQFVYGSHAFGYLSQEIKLMPLYELVVRGRIVEEPDLAQFTDSDDAGWAYRERIRFRDLEVAALRSISSQPKLTRGGALAGSAPLGALVPFLALGNATRGEFEETQKRLAAVSEGTAVYDVINALGGSYVTTDYGETYFVLMGGYLNWRPVVPWEETTLEGSFIIWPFGFMEDGKPVGRLAVIYRNHALLRVVPYSEDRDELRRHFHE
jgi:hypothetical protein